MGKSEYLRHAGLSLSVGSWVLRSSNDVALFILQEKCLHVHVVEASQVGQRLQIVEKGHEISQMCLGIAGEGNTLSLGTMQ